jgi:TolA-binding protein
MSTQAYPLNRLVRLAGEELDGTARPGSDAWLADVPMRVANRRRSRRIRAGAATAAMGLAAGVALFALSRPPQLSYAVLNGTESAGYVLARSDTKIRFSDGSQVSLDSGAQAKVADVDPNGARLNLRQGEAHVEIIKSRDTTWYVEAGPYTVHVTGTAFDVSWSEKERVFELALQRGSVVVKGPLVGSGFTMKPGQRMVGRADGYVVVEGPKAAAAAALPAAAAAPAPAQGAPDPLLEASDAALPADAEAAVSAATEQIPPEAHTRAKWSQLVAQGKFRQVLAEAQARGIEQTLATAPLADLTALSDAARYAQNRDIAKKTLLAERQRFPNSRAASDAAFLLGRLAEESGSGAVAWYDRYLARSPNGPYASQALGRKMMLSFRDGGAAQAEALAREYLERHPNGPYASAARKLVARRPEP